MEPKNERAAAPRSLLVIDRSKWARGDGDGALLRRSDARMCCLGFFGLVCGIPETRLLDQGTPEEIPGPDWPEWLLYFDDERGKHKDSQECIALVQTNDNKAGSDAMREKGIAAIFARHGVEVRFVDSTDQPAAQPPSSAIPDKEKGQ